MKDDLLYIEVNTYNKAIRIKSERPVYILPLTFDDCTTHYIVYYRRRKNEIR